MSDAMIFSLETDDLETMTFGIDEKMYTLHSFAQLTPNEASALAVIYRRMNVLAKKMSEDEDRKKLEGYASETRTLQDQLLAMMTDIPDEVRVKLRVDHRNVILKHISAMSINRGEDLVCAVCSKVNPGDHTFCMDCGDRLPKLALIEGEVVREDPAGEEETAVLEG